MRTGKRLEIGRGYPREWALSELSTRKGRHLGILEYRRTRPARIRVYRETAAAVSEAVSEYIAGRGDKVPTRAEAYRDFVEGLRDRLLGDLGRPCIVPPPALPNGSEMSAPVVFLSWEEPPYDRAETRETEPELRPNCPEPSAKTLDMEARGALNAHGRAHKGESSQGR